MAGKNKLKVFKLRRYKKKRPSGYWKKNPFYAAIMFKVPKLPLNHLWEYDNEYFEKLNSFLTLPPNTGIKEEYTWKISEEEKKKINGK